MVQEKSIRSVYDLIQKQLGVDVEFHRNRDVVLVAVSSLVVARADPARVALVMVNLSSNVIFVTPNEVASTSTGIRLGPNGGAVSMSYLEDLNLQALGWNGISDSGVNRLFVLEAALK